MVDKKRLRLYIKLVILILCFFIIIRIFVLTFSKYEAFSRADANIDVALYLLKEDYKSMSLNLERFYPRNDPYLYTFTIGNEDGENVAETNLNYDIWISATTNLPLEYEVYKNQTHDETGAQNVITAINVETDEHGTYFKKILLPKETMYFSNPQTITYQLVVYFPERYNTVNYQDIIESIEIIVDSKQIIE